MGLLPLSNESEISYTPEAYKDVPEEYRPIFKVRPFTKAEETIVKRHISSDDKISGEEKTYESVRKCLIGWENLIDLGSNSIIEYKAHEKGGCEKELFHRLPSLIIADLFLYIGKISGLLDLEKRGLQS